MARRLALITGLCLLTSLPTACGASNTGTAPSSPAPAAAAGVVQGIVKHETYVSHGLFPEGPLPGAQAVVTEGPGAGQITTTDANGGYRFDLPPGPFRVRWSAAAFETRDSDAGTVTAGSTTTVGTVVLRRLSNVPIAEWTIAGIIRDGLGNPVAGASLLVGDVFNVQVATGSTDAAGAFRIASTNPHENVLHIRAAKAGHQSQEMTVTCGPSCALTADFRLLRIVREWVDGPSTMEVGDVALVSLVDDYDDGSRSVFAPLVQSADPAVVQVLPLRPDDNRTYVKAVAPGATTLRILTAIPQLTFNIHVVR